MKSNSNLFTIDNLKEFKLKMLNWANLFSIFCFLDNNGYPQNESFPCILAAGVSREIHLKNGNAFSSLKEFYNNKPGWLFGYLGYALKDETNHLTSAHPDKTGFGAGHFFSPQILISLSKSEVSIECETQDASEIFRAINNQLIPHHEPMKVSVMHTMDYEEYSRIVSKLREHIKRGDCYEINFCQEFFSKDAIIEPMETFLKLMEVSPSPFAAIYKLHDRYCLCASPERFIKKSGSELMSQPMKGTSSRMAGDAAKDQEMKECLQNSPKEKSENVMIVDLVRNDLSRVCKEGSVYVDELFGVYSFPRVHQMISTIKGSIGENVHWTDVLSATFPMGSMTGAPKKRVLELIEKYETGARGLFSGSIGYVTPAADFDFNVVIRSIFYDSGTHYLSFMAGSGITFQSTAEDEYRECLLKAEAIMQVLKS